MLTGIADFIEDISDNVISISVFGSAIYFVYAGIVIPEFWAVILGMIAVHYFKKDK